MSVVKVVRFRVIAVRLFCSAPGSRFILNYLPVIIVPWLPKSLARKLPEDLATRPTLHLSESVFLSSCAPTFPHHHHDNVNVIRPSRYLALMPSHNHAGVSPAVVESVAGLSAGAVSTLVVHPLDIVKTRMQSMSRRKEKKRKKSPKPVHFPHSRAPPMPPPFDCLRQIPDGTPGPFQTPLQILPLYELKLTQRQSPGPPPRPTDPAPWPSSGP